MGWSMHAIGATYLVTQPSQYRRLEFGILALHPMVCTSALLYFLGPWSALVVVLIHKGVGGWLPRLRLCAQPQGMLQTDSRSRLDFVRTHVLTARNIRGHPHHGSLARLAELSDRALPVPEHAATQHAAGAGDRKAVLR